MGKTRTRAELEAGLARLEAALVQLRDTLRECVARENGREDA